MSVDTLQQLLIERECQRLIHRYAYLNDERHFDALITLFTEDAVLYRPSAPTSALRGRAAILAAFQSRPADVRTFHLCSDIVIDIVDAENVRARSRIVLLSGPRSDGAQGVDVVSKAPAPGTFEDHLRLSAQGWQFAQRRGGFWV